MMKRKMGSKAGAAVPALTLALTNESSGTGQMHIAEALGNIGPAATSASAALIAVVNKKSEFVKARGLAAAALGKINADPSVVVPVLLSAMAEAGHSYVFNGAQRGLERIGPKAVPALQEALNHDNKGIRKHAQTTLDNLSD